MSAPAQASAKHVDAVVIGTSAGGIQALSPLLSALPRGLSVPVFVVIHLPREFPSVLVDIFQPKCAVAVRDAVDKERVEGGVVYFAPPDYHLLVDPDGPSISLSSDEPLNFSRPAIDVLFETAADVYRDGLMGIVLTGGNHDGAAGLRLIGSLGGSTLVQDPEDAYATAMPRAAIELGAVDRVLSLDQIADVLRGLPAGDMVRPHTNDRARNESSDRIP